MLTARNDNTAGEFNASRDETRVTQRVVAERAGLSVGAVQRIVKAARDAAA